MCYIYVIYKKIVTAHMPVVYSIYKVYVRCKAYMIYIFITPILYYTTTDRVDVRKCVTLGNR